MESSTAQTVKLAVVTATGLSKDALHIYIGLIVFLVVLFIGLIVFLVVLFVTRKSLRSTIPWMTVLMVALLGELVDMRDDLASLGYWRWPASIHDIVNTIFWPSILLILARHTRVFDTNAPKT